MTLLGVPDTPGTSLALFSKIAAKNISVDMIVQNVGADSKADISFTVLARRLEDHARRGQRGRGRIGRRRIHPRR